MDAASIAKTLKAKGQAMTLTRVSGGIHDPVTGSISGAVTQSWTVYGITTNYNSLTRLASQSKPDSLILSGDRQAIINAGTVEPIPGDTLMASGVSWKVIAADVVDPAGTALLYKCQVRKG
jgi:hypothetical protein